MNEEAAQLLRRLWPDGWNAEQHRLTLWTLDDRRSEHVADVDAAASYAAQRTEDLYFGIALRRRGLGEHHRGAKDECTVLPCAALDLDGDDGKLGSRELIDKVTASFPVRPSAAVASGGGVHLYWIFHEPMELTGDEAILQAETVLNGWHYLAEQATTGIKLDHIWNVDRILRLPGTFNCKQSVKRPVRLIFADGPDCDPSDLKEFLPKGWRPHRVTPSNEPVNFYVNLECPMPRSVWAAIQNDTKLQATWERKRSEFKSQSEYDMSIASLLLQADLPDQDVVDAMVFHRDMGGEPPKDRVDYYRMTLEKAKQNRQDDRLVEKASDKELEGRQYSEEESRAVLRRHLNVDVDRITRVGESALDNCFYTVYAYCGEARTIRPFHMSDRQFRSYDGWKLIALESGFLPPSRPKAQPWLQCEKAMHDLITVDAASGETSPAANLIAMIEEYARSKNAAPIDDAVGAVRAEIYTTNRPFIEDGRLHVNRNGLKRWMATVRDRGFNPEHEVSLLRAIGAEPVTKVANPGKGEPSVGRSYWVIPEDVVRARPRLTIVRGSALTRAGEREEGGD